MMSNFTIELSKGYKNKSSNLILPKVPISLPVTKRLNLNSVSQGESIPTLVCPA